MKGPSLQVVSTDPLTRREAQVLLWIAEGKTAWETGLILGVSESTVTAHAKSAMLKLDAATRPHLVARGFVVGILRVGQALGVLVLALAMLVNASGDLAKHRPTVRRRRRDGDVEEVAHF